MTTEACLAGNKTLETARSDEFPAVTVISAPSVTWPGEDTLALATVGDTTTPPNIPILPLGAFCGCRFSARGHFHLLDSAGRRGMGG